MCTGSPVGRPNFAWLTATLDQGDRNRAVVISAVSGTAGVGKTALAVHWAHQVADRFPDGQLYVDLRGYSAGHPVSAEDALGGFLRALGVDDGDVPPTLGERAARYRTLLADRRMLVVLDNAYTVEQVRPLLPGGATCMALVTSRDDLAGLGRAGGRPTDRPGSARARYRPDPAAYARRRPGRCRAGRRGESRAVLCRAAVDAAHRGRDGSRSPGGTAGRSGRRVERRA
jgi:hypothetical protein